MVTDMLSGSFDVSRAATVIRLKELGYMNDARERSGLQPVSSCATHSDSLRLTLAGKTRRGSRPVKWTPLSRQISGLS